MYTYPQRPEEDVKFSGIGVTGSGEQPDVGTGNHILCVCVCVHGCVCPDTNQDFICQGDSTFQGAHFPLLRTANPNQNESVPMAHLP